MTSHFLYMTSHIDKGEKMGKGKDVFL
ncbi:hypothetical protein EMIT091MI3_30345 [Kosakonia quasisacchari]